MRGLGTALNIALIHSAWPFSNSLLAGGDKRTQDRDIRRAKALARELE
jgi:hypothetical protein